MIFVLGIYLGSLPQKSLRCASLIGSSLAISNKEFETDVTNLSVSEDPQSSTILSHHNLVITTAINFDLTAVYRFSRSLRASCNFCHLVVVVADSALRNDDFKQLAKLYSIVFISEKVYFPKHLRLNGSDIPFASSVRWLIIRNYLLTLEAKRKVYKNVFMCDSRDGLFQANIFQYVTNYSPGLLVFLESIHMTIGKCGINSGWIKKCYNDSALTEISNNSISCSGTVLGTWYAVLTYLSKMEFHIINAPNACKKYPGSDQGIHNYIIYTNKIVNVSIHYILHEYGFVGTLGYAPIVKRNQFGLVKNENGSVYAFIHQWDRSEQLKVQFQREYQLIPANVREKKQIVGDSS
ncbi:unnamed protein product [Adineta ricciae]|uniref:Uncharacterized protein n=1 Tax=Adineta ricciae TaxID=249248 RepID=A0A815TFI4_ADIRI|nr:unnamed protein product [Adineta ricciae]